MEDVSVCRAFCQRFPQGNNHVHSELVNFLMKHEAIGKKVDEWILSEDSGRSKYNMVGQRSETMSKTTKSPASSNTGLDKTRFDEMWKSDIKSKSERDLGNQSFKTRQYSKSLYHYNRAIRFASFPFSSSELDAIENRDLTCLSVAIANRSAVYFDMGEEHYEKSLKDIALAINFGYPEKLKTKLLLRKANILVHQGNHEEADECMDEAYASWDESVDQAKMGAKMKSTRLKITMGMLQPKTSQKSSQPDGSVEEPFLENSNFETASDLVSIVTKSDVGRHVISNCDLQEGTILFKEMPYASVLLPEFYESHCHHCHKCLSGKTGDSYFFPCRRCTQVLFCDDICAETAEAYHVHECGWLGLLHSVGIAHLAFRIVLTAGVASVQSCVKQKDKLSDLSYLDLFRKGNDPYDRVFSLVHHVSDMPAEDLFQYTLTACLLTKLLKSESSFLERVSEEDQDLIGGTLLRHICQLVCNAHAITDILPDDPSQLVFDEYQKRIATAIYPSASIMNHSCDSNIAFYFQEGKQLVVKASRAISKGQNVYNCYGPHYRRMPLAERQEILMQQYFFSCHCNKCEDEQVKGVSFSDQFQAFQCDLCEQPVFIGNTTTATCCKCMHKNNMKLKESQVSDISELQKKGEYLLEKGDVQEATKAFQSGYEMAEKTLFKNNSLFCNICDSLARCFVLTGKLAEAKDLLQQSLEYVETRFGSTSVEYKRELRKYQEIFSD